MTRPLCWAFEPGACPAVGTQFSVTKSFSVEADFPAGAHVVTFSILDTHASAIACVRFTINSSRRSPAVVLLSSAATHADAPVFSDEMMSALQKHAHSWRSKTNSKFAGKPLGYARSLCYQSREQFTSTMEVRPARSIGKQNIPARFESLEMWGSICPGIATIRDQGACASSSAIASVESVSDRICIASKGGRSTRLSAQDVVACCGKQARVYCRDFY